MPLTKEEELELKQLEGELGAGALSPAEEAELAELEKEFGPGGAESGLRGLAEGLTFGYAPEIAGGVESVAGSLGLVKDKSYEQASAESAAAFQRAQEANPEAFMAGQAASLVVPGLGAAKAGKAVAKGAMSVIKATSKKAGAISEKLVDKVARTTGTDTETVKDVAAGILDVGMTGGAASIYRAAKKMGKSLNKGASSERNATDKLLDDIIRRQNGKK